MHAYNTVSKCHSFSYASKNTNDSPSSCHPPSSFSLSAASINQQKSSVSGDLILIGTTWSSSRLFFSTCSADLSCPQASQILLTSSSYPRSRQTAFNSPDHNAVTTATQVLLAESAVALLGLRGEPGKKRKMRCRNEGQMGKRGSSPIKYSLYPLMYFCWMTVNVWPL